MLSLSPINQRLGSHSKATTPLVVARAKTPTTHSDAAPTINNPQKTKQKKRKQNNNIPQQIESIHSRRFLPRFPDSTNTRPAPNSGVRTGKVDRIANRHVVEVLAHLAAVGELGVHVLEVDLDHQIDVTDGDGRDDGPCWGR